MNKIDIRKIVTGPVQTNCYVVTSENRAIIIDPGSEDEDIYEFLENKTLDYVFLTHSHYDHIDGVNSVLERFPEAELATHSLEKESLVSPEKNLSVFMGASCSVKREVDILLEDRSVLNWNNTEIEIIHTPGHTIGGVCFYLHEQKILFSGDTLFRNGVGRSDLPGGNHSVLMKSIREKLMNLPDDTDVYPGHMEKTTIGHEKKYNPYII
ncbi:MAG: MBL fold metallo-hydrolase [bacterium]